MYKSYRFRLYPTTNQIELIHKTFGCTRVVYNHYLEKQKALYDEGKDSLSCFDMIKDLKNLQVEHPYLERLKKYMMELKQKKKETKAKQTTVATIGC